MAKKVNLIREGQLVWARGGPWSTCCHGKNKMAANVWRFCMIERSVPFPPLRKGSRCCASTLCSSQWRRYVYATFHLWDKENHCSSQNDGVFRAFRKGVFGEINRRWINFDYGNCEVLDSGVGAWERKKNILRFLLSYLPKLRRKKNVFFATKSDRYNMKNGWKLQILRKNIFGKRQTKYTPSGVQKPIRSRKSRVCDRGLSWNRHRRFLTSFFLGYHGDLRVQLFFRPSAARQAHAFSLRRHAWSPADRGNITPKFPQQTTFGTLFM